MKNIRHILSYMFPSLLSWSIDVIKITLTVKRKSVTSTNG